MSTCTDGGGALKLHFKGGHTPQDRENVLAAINAWNNRHPSRNDVLEEAARPFIEFGEFLEVETEGFSDTDNLELFFEDSNVRLDSFTVADFRRLLDASRALKDRDG